MELIKKIFITFTTILIMNSCFALSSTEALKNIAKSYGIYSAMDLNIKNIENVVKFLNSEEAQKFADEHYITKEQIDAHIVLLKQNDQEAWSKLKSKLQSFGVIPDSQVMLDEAKDLGIKSLKDINISNVTAFLNKPHIRAFAKILFNKDDKGIDKQVTLLKASDEAAWYQLKVLAKKIGLN